MFKVELYGRVRRAVLVERGSEHGVARAFGISRETVLKMLRYAVPPGYQRQQPVKRPKLGSWLDMINVILEEDRRRPARLRHTAMRIFDRLKRDVRGRYTVVKDYVRTAGLRSLEMFVPIGCPRVRYITLIFILGKRSLDGQSFVRIQQVGRKF